MKRAVGVLLAVLAFERAAEACSCRGPAEPCRRYLTSDAVFIGRVVDVRGDYRGQTTTFEVTDAYRGVARDRVQIVGEGTSCDFNFTAGSTYVVYADRVHGRLTADHCGGTTRLEDGTADVAYLQARRDGHAPTSLGGKVTELVARDIFVSPEEPLAGIPVQIQRAGGTSIQRITRADGRYDVDALRPGSYRVTVVVPPGFRPVPPASIAIAPGDCAGASFRTDQLTTVAGRVVDDRGRPVAHAGVIAVPAREGEAKRYMDFPSAGTSVDGRYSLRDLRPGRYTVSVRVSEERAATRWPSPSASAAMTVPRGPDAVLPDITVLPREPTSITGTVVHPSGSAATPARVLLFRSGDAGPTAVPVAGDGTFEARAFVGEQVWLAAEATGAEPPVHSPPIWLTVDASCTPRHLVLSRAGAAEPPVDRDE